MKGLRKLLAGFDSTMTAVTFAEAGEFETARKIMREEIQGQKPGKRLDKRVRPETVVHVARGSK